MNEHLYRMQQRLADELVEREVIASPAVEAAFRSVPRHLFVPHVNPDRAYGDDVIVTKVRTGDQRPISSSSQPTMMAIMLEQLGLQPGHHVLEIGAGSGYNAALMAHMVGVGGSVTTVDIDADLVEGARKHLQGAGYDQVTVVQADGMKGFAENAPYDRIILTVAASDITPAWRDQLAPDGRILLPLVIGDSQTSALFVRQGDGFVSLSSKPCRFMTLRGRFAAGDGMRQIKLADSFYALVDERLPKKSAGKLKSVLRTRSVERATGIVLNEWQLGLASAWVTLHLRGWNAQVVYITRDALANRADIIPYLTGVRDHFRSASGCIDLRDGTLALAMRPPEGRLPHQEEDPGKPFELWVRGYGGGQGRVDLVLEQVYRGWVDAGSPTLSQARLQLTPLENATTAPESLYRPANTVIGRYHQMFIHWTGDKV